MNTIKAQEKTSLFSKLINWIKNSALFDMFFNANSGMVISSEDLSSKEQVKRLAADTGENISTIEGVKEAFDKAAKNLATLQENVTKIPPVPNPFKVNTEDLTKYKQTPTPQNQKGKGIERVRGED